MAFLFGSRGVQDAHCPVTVWSGQINGMNNLIECSRNWKAAYSFNLNVLKLDYEILKILNKNVEMYLSTAISET